MALTESRRNQLDGIVSQMVSNKEPDSNIQFVVNDFKSKYENEGSSLAGAGSKTTNGGLMDWMKKGGPLPALQHTFIDPIGRELSRPVVSLVRGIQGKQSPVNTPFGQIKPYSALGAGEAAGAALETGLSVLPIEKVVGPLVKPIARFGKKILPSSETIAKALPGISRETTRFIRSNPELVKAAQPLVREEIAIPVLGEKIHKAALDSYKTAQKTWQDKEAAILQDVGHKFLPGAQQFSSNLETSLSKEGIRVLADTVDLTGTAFSRNPTAQKTLDAIVGITKEPTNNITSLLNKRRAITGIMEEIPKDASNVRRVAKEIVGQFDSMLDNITDGKASVLRKEYAKSVSPAKNIINQFTNKQRDFSADRATQFIKQAFSDAKFDNNLLLRKLDEVGGTNFAKQVKAIGVARAIDRLDPITSGRVFDVLKTYGIAKLPAISAFVSPKFWGERMLSSSFKTKRPADMFKKMIIQNLITHSGSQAIQNLNE